MQTITCTGGTSTGGKTNMEQNNTFGIITEPRGKCPVCRATGAPERLRMPMAGGGHAVFVDCPSCGLVYMDPAPTPASLQKFYTEVYGTPEYRTAEGFDNPDPRQELAAGLKYYEHVLNEIEQYRTAPGDLLDAGSGFGGVLLEARQRGWRARGIEPFAEAVEFCTTQLGLDVQRGNIIDAPFPDASFDVISLQEVVEHLDKPVPAMRRLAKLARPGALLMLTTPNPNSPAALLARDSWIGWKPPTHLCLFDFHTTRALLERTGWKPLKIKSCGMYPGQLIAFAELA